MKNHDENNTILAQERTLLAAERTFSAWVRTALSAMAGGIAILRLVIFKTDMHRIIAHIIGEILVVWGCFLIILAAIDYRKIRNKLVIANYKSTSLGFFVIVVPLLIISILLILVTLP